MRIILLLLSVLTVSAQDIYIHAGKIYDTDSGKLSSEKTIIISDNKIKSIENGYKEASEDDIKIYNLKSKVVLPGLIDFHVHMESQSGGQDRYVRRFQDNKADVAFRSSVIAKKTLMSGFTTVRDVGGSGVNISLRNAINNGVIPGPRIFTSGKTIATTGGHGDSTNGLSLIHI